MEEAAQAAKSAAAAAADVAKASQDMLISKDEGGFNRALICMLRDSLIFILFYLFFNVPTFPGWVYF